MATVIAFVVVGALLFMTHSVSAGRNHPREVEIANLNLLHGFDCDPALPAKGDQCRLTDRVDLLFKHLADIGCPDIVTLQEIVDRRFAISGAGEIVGPLDSARALIQAKLKPQAKICGFKYHLLFRPVSAYLLARTDEELILSRYPILEAESQLLHSALFSLNNKFLRFFARHVLFTRIDHPVGPIDVFTTHFSSDADFATNSCNSMLDFGDDIVIFVPCPLECDASQTVRECQAEQLALFIEERHDGPTPAYVSGDMNATPDSEEYETFVERGWIDTHLATGNSECNSVTGRGCTTGRDEVGGELENPKLNVDRRIDFVFLVPGNPALKCELVQANKRRSGLFAAKPNPFVNRCGPAPLPICWTSDHSGNFGNIRCLKKAK